MAFFVGMLDIFCEHLALLRPQSIYRRLSAESTCNGNPGPRPHVTLSGLFHVSKNRIYIAYFQGPVHIFGERNPVFTAPDPVSDETDSLGAVSRLTPYQLSVGITSITRITLALPTFQHYHRTRITSIS